jgi:hypothetical protein
VERKNRIIIGITNRTNLSMIWMGEEKNAYGCCKLFYDSGMPL